jgi:hypothetical protein
MGLLENVREIANVVREMGNLDLYRQILDLQAEVQQLTGDLLRKEELNRQKNLQIRELEEKLRFDEKLVRDRDHYFEADDSGAPKGRPYCSHCWEVDRIAVHIHSDLGLATSGFCPRCKNKYRYYDHDKDAPPPVGGLPEVVNP